MKNIVNRALVAKKKQFQSKSVPRGTRTIWRYLGALFILFTFAIGNVWAADITVVPTLGQNVNTLPYGLFTISHSSTKGDSKISSGAIAANSKEDVITINFKTTKSDMYIKSVTFNSLSNGTLSSTDGTISSNTFTASGNKNDVNIVLTSKSNAKGTVKITNVVVNTGTNTVETITFNSFDGTAKTFGFTSSAGASSSLTSISSNNSNSVSSNILTWSNGRTLVFAASGKIKYAAFVINDGKAYTGVSADKGTYVDNYSWTGDVETLTLTNGIGSGRAIKNFYLIIAPATKHHVTYNLNGATGTTPTQADVAEGGKFTLHNGTTGITAPENKTFAGWSDGTTTYAGGDEYTMGDDDVTFTAQWATSYDISYDKGAYGTGEIAGGKKAEDVAYTLSSSMFTRENYLQVGWATTDGASRSYMIGGSYTTNAAQTFYPAWAEKDTYVAAFHYDSENPTTPPAGWTFANAGTYTNTSATVAYVGKFTAEGETTASGKGMDPNHIAFAKNADADAVYDLGYVTTVSAVTGTLMIGSTSAKVASIDYLAADGSTVLHSFNITHNKADWGANNFNETEVVPNVRYIRINGKDFWQVLGAFSVTYGSLVTKYDVTFDKNDAGASGSQATLKYAEGVEVTLPAISTFTAPDDMEFDAWISDDVTILNNNFTMPGKDVVIKATWKSACASAPTVSATTLGTTSYTTQVVNCAGISVLGSAGCTISEYGFVYGTATAPTISDNKKALEGNYTVINTAFAETTLTGLAANTKYYVRAYATNSFGTAYGEEISFTTLAPLGNVLVIAGSASQTSDAITAMRNAGFVVTVSAHDHERSYTGYDLVVLDESLGGGDAQTATNEESKIKDVNIPILNLKAFFYTKTNRWNWGSPVNGTGGNEIANIPTTYKNTQSHPIFEGLTITAGAIDLIDPAVASGNTLQGVTTNTLVEGKEGYTLATSGDGITFIHELTPAQRGVTDAKYLMIAFANNAKDNLSADGERLIVNAAKYLISSTAWEPQYYTVSFEAHGDADPSPLTGKTITLPSAANGTASLLGWFTEETGGTKIGEAGESYTPTADITLHAQWETVSTDARLSAITFSSDAGTLAPAFDPEVTNYTYTMPYGTAAIPTITGATKANPAAKDPVIDAQAAAWGETAHVHGVAASDDTKDYYVQMLRAPKDGTCIVKADLAAGSSAASITATSGAYKDADNIAINVAKDLKLGSTGAYVKVAVKDTYFQDGDVVEIVLRTDKSASAWLQIFADEGTTLVAEMKSGVSNATPNHLTISGVPENTSALYLYRTEAADGDMNPYPTSMAVYRAMNPVLTAIQFNSTDVEVTSTTVAALLPQGTNLGTMTVTPTIYWNGAGTAEVTSNEGAWAWGTNTYRVTDKDGDYTEYTITLTEDELKHTVSFNTHGGSAIDPVQVVDGQKLAAAPTDPTKEDYLFQGWSETDGGSIVDVTTITISADKEFHAVWAPDGAIKLLNGATVNHTNFITGVTADETVEFMGNEVHYAKFSGTVSGVNGVKDLTRVIAYNATTNKTKIQISAHNNSTSGRSILVKGLVEGASAAVDLATIDMGNKEDKVSEWIEFNNVANRTIYIMVSSSAGDVYFTQVKVIESGETPMKQAGEAGYSLNFNKGRFFGVKDVTAHFEGLDVEVASSDCAPLNTEVVKLNNTSMSFIVATPLTLTVTTNNNKTYYVTEGAAGTDNETAKTGATDFDLTAGTWYITGGASNVEITNIAFAAPKCEQPTVVDMENIGLCEGDAFIALNVSANVTDGGTLHYQWYKHPAEGDDEAVGTDAASYTPTADGQYYVVVTNKLAGYMDNAKTSNTVTVAHFASAAITTAPENQRKEAGQVATLTVVATGKAPLTYQWYKCDDEAGNNPVIIDGADEDTYEVTVTAAMSQYYKVVVGSGCGSAEAVALVEEWHELPQVPVSATTTWDWTYAGPNIKLTDDTTTPKKNEECVMANVKVGGNMPTNDATFNSQALVFYGENVRAVESSRAYASIGHIKFNVTVPGRVTVEFSDNGNNNRKVKINDAISQSSSSKTDVKTFSAIVPAGEVMLEGVNEDGTGNNRYIRISKIIFDANPDPAGADYTRGVTEGRYGTICLPNGGIMVGAELFEIAYYGQTSHKIFLDNIPSGEMVAGRPYIFLPKEGTTQLAVFYTDETNASAGSHNGLIGFIGDAADEYFYIPAGAGNYILQNNLYREVLAGGQARILSNRAYINLSAINPTVPALAPGRRRVAMGVQSEQVATGCENLNVSDKPVKMIINGQLFIIRGEKMYDAKGQLVK